MSIELWEDQLGSDYSHKSDKPFFSLDYMNCNEDDLHKWIKGQMAYLQDLNFERFSRIKHNLALYKGVVMDDSHDRRRDFENTNKNGLQQRRMIMNEIAQLVDNNVARQVKYRPAVSILPSNDEHADKIAAQQTKLLLDHIWYNEKFDSYLHHEWHKAAKICGESYLWVTFNPQKGDLHPEFKKKKELLKDENGKPIMEDGLPVIYDNVIRVGEVEYDVVLPLDVLLHRVNRFDHCEFAIRKRTASYQELIQRFPSKGKHINTNGTRVYDYELLRERFEKDQVTYYEFYHKRTDTLDKGAWITLTDQGILDKKEFPFSHRNLPFVRLSDVENPGNLHGESIIQRVESPAAIFNNLTEMAVRNLYLVSHPKWMLPAGSAKVETLGNDITIVNYKGPTPPQLMTFGSVPSDLFSFRDKIKQEFQQYAKTFLNPAQPPPGVKSGVALQFLAEQEAERYNEDILKGNQAVVDVAQMTLAVAGDYYEPSDERMIRILGNNNEWSTEFFDIQNLSKSYDIRIQNSSALPQSRAARTQYLMDLKGQFPDIISNDQFIDLLDLGQTEKFVDIAATSVRAAQAEIEQISKAQSQDDIPEPALEDDHVTHWKLKVNHLRQWGTKNKMPAQNRKWLQDVVAAHEMMMLEKELKDPTYAQLTATLPGFPIFLDRSMFQPPAPPVPAPVGQIMDPGVIPGGAPVDIGGLDPMMDPQMPVNPDVVQPGVSPEDPALFV